MSLPFLVFADTRREACVAWQQQLYAFREICSVVQAEPCEVARELGAAAMVIPTCSSYGDFSLEMFGYQFGLELLQKTIDREAQGELVPGQVVVCTVSPADAARVLEETGDSLPCLKALAVCCTTIPSMDFLLPNFAYSAMRSVLTAILDMQWNAGDVVVIPTFCPPSLLGEVGLVEDDMDSDFMNEMSCSDSELSLTEKAGASMLNSNMNNMNAMNPNPNSNTIDGEKLSGKLFALHTKACMQQAMAMERWLMFRLKGGIPKLVLGTPFIVMNGLSQSLYDFQKAQRAHQRENENEKSPELHSRMSGGGGSPGRGDMQDQAQKIPNPLKKRENLMAWHTMLANTSTFTSTASATKAYTFKLVVKLLTDPFSTPTEPLGRNRGLYTIEEAQALVELASNNTDRALALKAVRAICAYLDLDHLPFTISARQLSQVVCHHVEGFWKICKYAENERIDCFRYVTDDELLLMEEVGRGSSGAVRKARWKDQFVAVKTMPELSADSHDALLQRRELAITTLVRHMNLVATIGGRLSTPSRSGFVVMELMKTSLYDVLHSTKVNIQNVTEALGMPIKLRMARDIAGGMAHLHSLDIVHRDLKSLNILLDDLLRARVCDFGMSGFLRANNTATGNLTGTAQWMAPELFRQQTFTKASDVYAFAVVLWEIFTLHVPFNKTPVYQIPNLVCKGARPDEKLLKSRNPPVPKEVRKLIAQCWRPKPQKRPTFEQICLVLDRLIGSYGRPSSKDIFRAVSGYYGVDQVKTMLRQNAGSSKELEMLAGLRKQQALAGFGSISTLHLGKMGNSVTTLNLDGQSDKNAQPTSARSGSGSGNSSERRQMSRAEAFAQESERSISQTSLLSGRLMQSSSALDLQFSPDDVVDDFNALYENDQSAALSSAMRRSNTHTHSSSLSASEESLSSSLSTGTSTGTKQSAVRSQDSEETPKRSDSFGTASIGSIDSHKLHVEPTSNPSSHSLNLNLKNANSSASGSGNLLLPDKPSALSPRDITHEDGVTEFDHSDSEDTNFDLEEVADQRNKGMQQRHQEGHMRHDGQPKQQQQQQVEPRTSDSSLTGSDVSESSDTAAGPRHHSGSVEAMTNKETRAERRQMRKKIKDMDKQMSKLKKQQASAVNLHGSGNARSGNANSNRSGNVRGSGNANSNSNHSNENTGSSGMYSCAAVQKRSQAEMDAFENRTEEQVRATTVMRARLEKKHADLAGYYDDVALVRFLRARQWKTSAALTLLKTYSAWHNRYTSSGLVHPDEIEHIGRMDIFSAEPGRVDVDGRRIVHMRTSLYFPSDVPAPDLIKALVAMLDEVSNDYDVQVNGYTFLCDMRDWKWKNFSRAYAQSFFNMVQSGAMVNITRFVLYCVPGFFNVCWSMIRGMMSKQFASRFKFVTRDTIESVIALEHIPRTILEAAPSTLDANAHAVQCMMEHKMKMLQMVNE